MVKLILIWMMMLLEVLQLFKWKNNIPLHLLQKVQAIAKHESKNTSKTQEEIEKEEILKQKKAGFQQLVLLIVGSLLMLLIGFYAPSSFMQHFIVFVLSCFVGFQSNME